MERVGVLIFVNEHMVESRSDFCRKGGFLHHMAPVEQQIVIVEHVVALLRNDVLAEQLFEFIPPVSAPGEYGVQRSSQLAACIDRMGINRQAGVFLWKARFLLVRNLIRSEPNS